MLAYLKESIMKYISGLAIIFLLTLSSAFSQTKLNGESFSERLKNTPNAQLVDVRTAEEYGAGHLPNARNVDFRKNDFLQQMESLDKNEPVMIYCLGGGRSAEAAKLLVAQGFKEVYDLEGGYMRWTVEKRPVEGVDRSNNPTVGMPVSEYNELIASDKPVLVDFTAKWCAPCKALYPKIKKMESEFEGRAIVKIIDIDVNKTVAEHLGIQYLPLIYLYKDGQIVWQTTGAVSENKLREVISEQL